VRSLARALQRWSGRHRSRLATVGLALVLVLLAGFSLWAAVRTNAAARQVDRDNAEQRVWQDARLELATAEAARHAFVEHGRSSARVDMARTTKALHGALEFITLQADPDDVSFAQQVASELVRYQQATGRLLAAVAVGNTTRVDSIEAREVEPALAALADELEEGAQDEQEQLEASVAAQRELGRTLVVAVPVVFSVGLGLLIGCWVLLVSYQRRISHQALSDPLTGLPDRTLLYDRTGQAMRHADRELVPAALALIDLDRFKEVNETLGHHYGDQLLIMVGQRLRATLRQVDTVARLGGDEFAVLLPQIETRDGAVSVASKLQAALEEPFVLDGLTLDVEASIGMAIYPDHGNDPEELLQRADIAMYTAKETHAGFLLLTPSKTSTAQSGWPCWVSCAAPSSSTNSCSTTSPRSTPTPVRCWGWRRWCAGNTPTAGWSRRTSSSPWPSAPDSSSPSPTTSWTQHWHSAANGARPVTSSRWRSTSRPGGCSTSTSPTRSATCWTATMCPRSCW
jgi:diguanylate cyclase (GGDEF)-like protein